MKYSGMGLQMAILLLVGTYLGKKLDEHFATEKPYFTALLAILFLGAAFYIILKDLTKKPDEPS